MDSIFWEGVTITYKVVRRRRKTVGITVSPEEGVSVAAPLWVNKGQIREIMEQKAHWIRKKLEQLKERKAAAPHKEFIDGESFCYLGKEYPLDIMIVPGRKCRDAILEDGVFRVGIPEGLPGEEQKERVKGQLIKWYAASASRILGQRMELYAELMGVKPSKIVIRGQNARWGSCSSRGNISLNWKMMMAPIEVIDYVVLHELCHLVHLNHSKKFWALVDKYMPDYKNRKKWLRLHEEYLKF